MSNKRQLYKRDAVFIFITHKKRIEKQPFPIFFPYNFVRLLPEKICTGQPPARNFLENTSSQSETPE